MCDLEHILGNLHWIVPGTYLKVDFSRYQLLAWLLAC
jgi:hypothetical protein